VFLSPRLSKVETASKNGNCYIAKAIIYGNLFPLILTFSLREKGLLLCVLGTFLKKQA
jgi:hypothetical protein